MLQSFVFQRFVIGMEGYLRNVSCERLNMITMEAERQTNTTLESGTLC